MEKQYQSINQEVSVRKYDKTKFYDIAVSFILANLFLLISSFVVLFEVSFLPVNSWLVLFCCTVIFYFIARFTGRKLHEKNKLTLRHLPSVVVVLLILLWLGISGHNFIGSFKNYLLFRDAEIVVGSDINQYKDRVLWDSNNFRRDDIYEKIPLDDFLRARLNESYDQMFDLYESGYIFAKKNPISGLLFSITFNNLLIFNEDFSYIEKIEIPVKKQSFRDTFVAEWVGDDIVAYEKKDANYYIYKQKTDRVEVLPNSRRKILRIRGFPLEPRRIPFYGNPTKTLIATSYCVSETNLGQGFSGARCTKYGVSLVNTFGVKEIATIKVKKSQLLDIGWDNNNNLYIKIFTPANIEKSSAEDKMYIINTAPILEGDKKEDYSEAERIDTELGKPKGEPVWMEQKIKTEEIVNIIEFEAEFIGGEGSEGLLVVYFDGEEVGRIYEYKAPKGLNKYVFKFNDSLPGVHNIKFYLEPLNKKVRSNIKLENIKTGFIGF